MTERAALIWLQDWGRGAPAFFRAVRRACTSLHEQAYHCLAPDRTHSFSCVTQADPQLLQRSVLHQRSCSQFVGACTSLPVQLPSACGRSAPWVVA